MSFFNFLSQVLQTSEEDEEIDPESINLTYITDRVIGSFFEYHFMRQSSSMSND
jgi:hypothetical protein